MRVFVVALLFGMPLWNASIALAESAQELSVEHVWTRATPKGADVGVAYATVVNRGESDDRLISAASPVSEKVEFHSMTSDDGIMRMRQLQSVAIPAGATVAFGPSGNHLMLLGLKRALVEGEAVPLRLTFERAGSMDVSARVGKFGSRTEPAN